MATAGVIATRRRPVAGTLLFAAGVTAVALADAALRAKLRGDAQPPTYDPVDTLKPLADGIWVVDSGPLHGVAPLRMTVIRLPDGGLLLHSPTRSTPQLRAELDRIGPVRALLAPNLAHWLHAVEWQRTYPRRRPMPHPACAAASRCRRPGLRIDHELDPKRDGCAAPAAWADMLELVRCQARWGSPRSPYSIARPEPWY